LIVYLYVLIIWHAFHLVLEQWKDKNNTSYILPNQPKKSKRTLRNM